MCVKGQRYNLQDCQSASHPSCQPTFNLLKSVCVFIRVSIAVKRYLDHGSFRGLVHYIQAGNMAACRQRRVLEKELRGLHQGHREPWKNWRELRARGLPPQWHTSAGRAVRSHSATPYGLCAVPLQTPPSFILFYWFFSYCLSLVLEIGPRASLTCLLPLRNLFCHSPSIYLCLWI